MKRILLLLILSIFCVYLTREVIYIGVRKNKRGEFDKLNTIFVTKNTYDVLFVGSSRAESGFLPPLIDSISHLDSYNIGLEGASIHFAMNAYYAYLLHSKAPKYLILNIDFHNLFKLYDTVYRFPRYFPYLNNKRLYQTLYKNDNRFFAFKYIPFYSMPYFGDNYLNASVRGWLGFSSDYDKQYLSGYTPSPLENQGDIDTVKYNRLNLSLHAKIVTDIDVLVDSCNRSNTKIIAVLAPIYHKNYPFFNNLDSTLNKLKTYFTSKQIPVFDYTKSDFIYDKSLYSDPKHFNRKGARIFSKAFGHDLMQFIDANSVN